MTTHLIEVMEMFNITTKWKNCADEEAFVFFSYVFFSIIFFPTVFGNSLIIISIVKFQHLRTNMHVLIGNLAVSDMIIGISIILQVIGTFNAGLAKQKLYCLGQNSVFVISLGTSSFNLLAMSVERFTAIRFPFKHRTMLSRRVTYVTIIVICWSYHFLIAALPVIGWNNYNNETLICDTDLVWNKSYDVLLFGSTLAVVAVNAVLCCVVVRTIIKGHKVFRCASARSRSSSSSSINTSNIRRNFHRTKMTLVVFGVFVLCWLPYLVLSLLLTVYDVATVRCIRQWSICLGIINSATNWIIYGLANKQFREAFKAVLKCRDLARYTVQGSIKHI